MTNDDWNLPPEEAIALQRELARRVRRTGTPAPVTTIAGVDAGYREGIARAAIVVLRYPSLAVVASAVARRPVAYPYIPGLLTFREGPAVLDALAKLTVTPDLFLFDGQGIAHPRRLGIASHIGVLIDAPSIGCAKSRLCGVYAEPGEKKGSFSLLRHRGETIGAVVRTRTGVKPVFVSIGHRVDLQTAIHYVLACCTRYRLPEPTRLAHRLASGTSPSLPLFET
ncbi:MAG: deoxyribonuclease V [Caldilineae bacterium]|nr:MAG: deoxyribonuclease V [Caldilineae bacterium]